MIFTEKTFKSLKREISKFKSNEPISKAAYVKQVSNIKKKQIQVRIRNNYEPSNALYVQESSPWRWRRVNEYFDQSTSDDRQNISLENVLKKLQE